MSEAFKKSTNKQRTVILIDEIDKADIDFPNDLLNELESYEFTVTETVEEVKRPPDLTSHLITSSTNP